MAETAPEGSSFEETDASCLALSALKNWEEPRGGKFSDLDPPAITPDSNPSPRVYLVIFKVYLEILAWGFLKVILTLTRTPTTTSIF